MGIEVNIKLHFQTEEAARAAHELTLDVMKVYTMMNEGEFSDDEQNRDDPLMLYWIHRKRVREFQLDEWLYDCYKYTAYKRLSCYGTTVELEQCPDFQRWLATVDEESRDEFFYTLCLVQALEHPQTPFEAVYRYEMPVSGSVEKTWVTFDGTFFHIDDIYGEMPFDENDRSQAITADWDIRKYRDYYDELDPIPADGKERIKITDGVLAYWMGQSEHIGIPDEVTSINRWAFEFCDRLRTVTLPKGLRQIDDFAFAGCDRLESITIPAGVTAIGEGAFLGCASLKNVVIPEGVTEIGWDAFCGCKSLESVTFPESLRTIGNAAFKSCPCLHKVVIPEGVEKIGIFAFGYLSVNHDDMTYEFMMVGADESEAHRYARCEWIYIEDFDGEELQ